MANLDYENDDEEFMKISTHLSLRRGWLALAMIAIVVHIGCSDDTDGMEGERCPSGAFYDEDLERCGECPDGATCLDDVCICDPGFVSTSNGCELEEVGDPAQRTSSEVCQRWNEDPWTLTFDKWAEEPADQCDWGWLSEEYHLEAIREVTRYRWLVGLPAVTTDENAREITQACATTPIPTAMT